MSPALPNYGYNGAKYGRDNGNGGMGFNWNGPDGGGLNSTGRRGVTNQQANYNTGNTGFGTFGTNLAKSGDMWNRNPWSVLE